MSYYRKLAEKGSVPVHQDQSLFPKTQVAGQIFWRSVIWSVAAVIATALVVWVAAIVTYSICGTC